MTIAPDLFSAGANDSVPPGSDAAERLRLVRIGDEDWLIHDLSYPENDARHLVACVRERALDHVDVIWLQGREQPTRFARVGEVMDAAYRGLRARARRDPGLA